MNTKTKIAFCIFVALLVWFLPTSFTSLDGKHLTGQVFAQDQDLQTRIQQIKEQIVNLQAQIAKLEAQLEEIQKVEEAQKVEFKFTKTLYRGMRGDEVKQLQEFLKQSPDIYPEGLVTGYFGPLTEAAVKRFQEKYGVDSIGVVGPKTRAKLNELFVIKSVSPEETVKPEPEKIVEPEEKKETVLPTSSIPQFQFGPPATWSEWLKKEWEDNIEDIRSMEEWAKDVAGWPSLKNDSLPQLIEWSKEHQIKFIGIRGNSKPESSADEVSLTAVPGIDIIYKELINFPLHLIKLLKGTTIYISIQYGGSSTWTEPDPETHTGKAFIIQTKPPDEMTHELAHALDMVSIRVDKSSEFTIGKTDEEVLSLRTEFERVFQVPKEPWMDPTKAPPGYLIIYASTNSLENFAVHFDYYINNPSYFLERAAKEPALAEKYEFLKTKIFLGKEYGTLSTPTQAKEEPSKVICQNECDQADLRKCVDKKNYQVCGNYDADNCLEWSAFTACSPSYACQNGDCVQQECSDGTPYSQCSITKPKYCDNGNLKDNCQSCGCGTDGVCKQDGSCFQSGPPATWPDWLKQEREENIEDVLKAEEFMRCCWNSLENEDLPQFIEWAKERGINLVGIKKTEESKSDFWNFTAAKMSLTAVPGIDLRFEMLKKLPEHLLNLARGQAIFFWGESCIGYFAEGSYLEELSQTYQKKFNDLPQDIRDNACAAGIPQNLSFLKTDTYACMVPRDIFVCKGYGLEIHEFGHLVDWNGIRMARGRDFALSKTDEGIAELYNEYKRVFEPTEEQRQWTRQDMPPPGMLSYGQANSLENFAVHFDYYVMRPEYFREKAATNASLAEKYEFLKTKIFLGQEY